LFFPGELAQARTHLEQGIALYKRPQHHASGFLVAGLDPGVMCLNTAALTLWHLGYPTQALERSNEAIQLAQKLAHSGSVTDALFFAAILHQFRRERQLTCLTDKTTLGCSRSSA
jgi:predicted ATPase